MLNCIGKCINFCKMNSIRSSIPRKILTASPILLCSYFWTFAQCVNKYFWPWPELPLTCHSGLSMTICHKADKPSLNFYSKWVNIGSFLGKKLGPAPQMKILPWAITWHLDCRALGESWYILCMVSWRLWNFQTSHQVRIQIRVWVL